MTTWGVTIKLYLKLLLNYTTQLDNCSSEQKVLLVQNTSDYLNKVLEVAKETQDLSESTAKKLNTILDELFSACEYQLIEGFCKQFIAMNITDEHPSWIVIYMHLISSQVALESTIEDQLFQTMLHKSSKSIHTFTTNKAYWKFLNSLYRLGCLCSEYNNQEAYAELCYKTVFDLSDGKKIDSKWSDFDTAYKKSGSALIEMRLKLGMQITSDILDKFLAIEPLNARYSYNLPKLMTLWKRSADLLFTSEHFIEAERCYTKIVDLMSSDDWQSIIKDYDDEYCIDALGLPIESMRQLVTLQLKRGLELQDVMGTVFLKIKHMIRFLETVDPSYGPLEMSLLNNVTLLFNSLGETISSDLDYQTFDVATGCFLAAYEAALRNDNNNYSDVNPTLQKLLTHYQSMEKQSTFITRLSAIFSQTLSPVTIKQSFHLIYVNCINAIENANKVEMQFFMAAFKLLEKFTSKSKSKDDRVVLWQDFFEQGNHKEKFLQLYEKLKDNLNNSVKRKSSDDLYEYSLKRSKTDSLPIEIDSVPQTDQQPVLVKSYSQSANGFNGFFSIQQNNQQKSKYKSAHHFDFDQTLTKVHVHDWQKAPSAEQCKAFLREETIKTLRFILQSGNYVSIVTNGTGDRIKWVLLQAGLKQEELDKIIIKAAASPTIVNNFKSGVIRTLAEQWKEAKNHYFYDDRENFCTEVWKMRQEFENKGKHLHVMFVSREPHDCSHLAYAWQKAAESSSEKEPLEAQFSFK